MISFEQNGKYCAYVFRGEACIAHVDGILMDVAFLKPMGPQYLISIEDIVVLTEKAKELSAKFQGDARGERKARKAISDSMDEAYEAGRRDGSIPKGVSRGEWLAGMGIVSETHG